MRAHFLNISNINYTTNIIPPLLILCSGRIVGQSFRRGYHWRRRQCTFRPRNDCPAHRQASPPRCQRQGHHLSLQQECPLQWVSLGHWRQVGWHHGPLREGSVELRGLRRAEQQRDRAYGTCPISFLQSILFIFIYTYIIIILLLLSPSTTTSPSSSTLFPSFPTLPSSSPTIPSTDYTLNLVKVVLFCLLPEYHSSPR